MIEHHAWAAQSVRQYGFLVAISIAMQGFLVGTGSVLSAARSAAWWVTLLSGSVSGGVAWHLVWVLMRGETARTLPEALAKTWGRTIGGIMSITLALVLAFDGALALRALGSVVRQYLIVGANESIVMLVVLALFALVLSAFGDQGLSRVGWLLGGVLLFGLFLSVLCMAQNMNMDNLFPLVGNSQEDTLGQVPIAMSGFLGVLLLGALPRQTGSTRPIRFRTGVLVLWTGVGIAGMLLLMVNLSFPPRALSSDVIWGRRLLYALEYTQTLGLFRVVYLCVLVWMLLITVGIGIAVSAHFVGDAMGIKQRVGPILGIVLLLALVSLDQARPFTQMEEAAMVWRLPVVLGLLLMTVCFSTLHKGWKR